MPSLHELQSCMATAIVTGEPGFASATVIDDAPGAAARIGIYRNHYVISLTEALAATFPVVQKLVGERFFAQVARRFVGVHPPAVPCLIEYGDAFADFLQATPETATLAYLADVARLEWALNQAFFADDAISLASDALTVVPPDQLVAMALTLHPSVHLIASDFPIDRIWQVNHADATEETIDLEDGAVRLLIHRSDDDAGWLRLDEAGFAFVQAIADGQSIADAVAVGLGTGMPFDFAELFGALLQAGVFTSVKPTSHQSNTVEVGDQSCQPHQHPW